ncbi:16S rRNA (guanine(966)-N(2))-methyltransferase RsmD [Helicobacter sp. 11S03491-1]|uniref:16S rRNA (guanine(966)-N(2))-methyltransferase RsmD n=1 Tax=Helicobacter sp. 11S03491-1 TaxID=1476196 RepID=UPI000BA53283|nr:16S rRNA (guanine(966)-N(2))-methyltransferase RsmD [Helicobacter sp. 11S03491-1]PAF41233.1 16S rRNA (guanine(966)-N(2))-methyltransferase RsmD [Helicobacter sp. 11S03491-1]
MNNKSGIKIIAGKFKGIHLQMPHSSITRSTKAILKESLFNTLGTDIMKSCFIEAFGGSGSIGLEALSRGADETWFFEQDKSCFEILCKNIKLLESKDPSLITQSFLGDTFLLLPQNISKNKQKKILYLDPPFHIREHYIDIYQKCITLVELIWEYNLFLIIFEHSSDYKLPQNIAHFSIIKQKKFGKSSLTYYAPSQEYKGKK